MNKQEVITLQIGPFSNVVGSYLWNLRSKQSGSQHNDHTSVHYHCGGSTIKQRSVMIDLCQNMGSAATNSIQADSCNDAWNGSVQRHDYTCGTPIQYWLDILQQKPHDKSLCPLPAWITTQSFDSFSKGKLASDSYGCISEDFLEDVLDRLRYFAEASDYLSSINCIVDLQEGYGGLTTSLLDRIAEDYGNSLCLPVWAFTETPDTPPSGNTTADQSALLQKLNVPMSYHGILEHSQLLIPIDAKKSIANLLGNIPVTTQNAAFLSALAIDSSLSFLNDDDSMKSVRDWIGEVTSRSRHPVCSMEVCIADLLLRNRESAAAADDGGDGGDFAPSIIQTFDQYQQCFQTEEARQHMFDREHLKQQYKGAVVVGSQLLTSINPFTSSLSSANFGSWSYQPDTNFQYRKAFSNVLNIRGKFSEDIRFKLFENCINSPYMVSSVHQYTVPQVIDEPIQIWTSDTSQVGQLLTERRYSTISSVGCNELMGRHMGNIVRAWESGAKASEIQLEKIGWNKEECREVTEQLIAIKQGYFTSTAATNDKN